MTFFPYSYCSQLPCNFPFSVSIWDKWCSRGKRRVYRLLLWAVPVLLTFPFLMWISTQAGKPSFSWDASPQPRLDLPSFGYCNTSSLPAPAHFIAGQWLPWHCCPVPFQWRPEHPPTRGLCGLSPLFQMMCCSLLEKKYWIFAFIPPVLFYKKYL